MISSTWMAFICGVSVGIVTAIWIMGIWIMVLDDKGNEKHEPSV